jgi:hypothetical protein
MLQFKEGLLALLPLKCPILHFRFDFSSSSTSKVSLIIFDWLDNASKIKMVLWGWDDVSKLLRMVGVIEII